jgi:hypothetical protein
VSVLAILGVVLLVFGFTVCGLLAWSLCRVAADADRDRERFQ